MGTMEQARLSSITRGEIIWSRWDLRRLPYIKILFLIVLEVIDPVHSEIFVNLLWLIMPLNRDRE